MNYIRSRVLNGEVMFGIGASLGSSLTVEMIGEAGFDWVWIDCEHGTGGYSELISQVQAACIGQAAPIVRIAWNEASYFKRVLDLGAAGIMVPYINTAEEARYAARAMRYPYQGVRGVAMFNRACGFGREFSEYFCEANDNLLTVVQIETREALENVDEIAAIEGVDVLFVGPLDLSVNLGIVQHFDHPDFVDALETVAQACQRHGKAAGALVPDLNYLEQWMAKGFTFLVVGTDGGILAKGIKDTGSVCARFKRGKNGLKFQDLD